jgi:hypothetical protein
MTANLLLSWNSGGIHLPLCACFPSFAMLLSWSNSYSSVIAIGTFTIYALVSAFTVVFVTLWVPETKGRTLEEIQGSFRWTCLLKHVFILICFWSEYHAGSITYRCWCRICQNTEFIIYNHVLVICIVFYLPTSYNSYKLWIPKSHTMPYARRNQSHEDSQCQRVVFRKILSSR